MRVLNDVTSSAGLVNNLSVTLDYFMIDTCVLIDHQYTTKWYVVSGWQSKIPDP